MVDNLGTSTSPCEAPAPLRFDLVAIFDRDLGLRVVVGINHRERLMDFRLERQRAAGRRWRPQPGGVRLSLDDVPRLLEALAGVGAMTDHARKPRHVDMTTVTLQGGLDASYWELVRAFGAPQPGGDPFKIDAEWTVDDPITRLAARVYNWKNGPKYCGPEGTPVEDITEWHIGGADQQAVALVYRRLGRASGVEL